MSWICRPTWSRPRLTGMPAKPDAAFFRALLDTVPWDAEEIVYVGDRLDNDLKPG